jgi:hypothetical protein
MPRTTPAVPVDLQQLSGRFEDWRRTRRGKVISEPLWAAAAELARSYGVCQTAQVLRLEYKKERAGQIELPPVRRHIRGQYRTGRPRPEAVLIDDTPLVMPLNTLGPVDIPPVRRTAGEPCSTA